MGKRIVSRRRGSGGHVFQSPSHRHAAPATLPKVHTSTAVVEDLYHNPGHTVPFARIRLADGRVCHVPAADGLAVGASIDIGEGPARPGSVLPVGKVPEGTPVFCIELRPGDGGKLVRSAGTKAVVIASTHERVTIQLPTGQFRDFHPACRAIVGAASGGGRIDKPLAKAGKMYHKIRSLATYWPVVRGVAKNPVDHPFGGGSKQHPGKPKTVGGGTPPGRKVGSIRAKRTGKRGG